MTDKIVKTDEEWRKLLTPEQYEVTRKKGTERAFTGQYWDFHDQGVYLCICCGNELFDSETKFESGCGWPSFYAPKDESKVVYVCACLKTKSCPCMTEARMEGPCACGTQGGPPLKAVPKDSAWAKENRKALGK